MALTIRELPGAGKLSAQELQAISQKSWDVLRGRGPGIQWLYSDVTDDKIYGVYIAPSEALIREHAQKGGFPANRISEIKTVIDPIRAEYPLARIPSNTPWDTWRQDRPHERPTSRIKREARMVRSMRSRHTKKACWNASAG